MTSFPQRCLCGRQRGGQEKREGQQRSGRPEIEVAPPTATFKYSPAALETSGGEEVLQQCISYCESFNLDVDLRNVIRELIINSVYSC